MTAPLLSRAALNTVAICLPTGAGESVANRAEQLAAGLYKLGAGHDVAICEVRPEEVGTLAGLMRDAYVFSGFTPAELVRFGALRAPIVWDLGGVEGTTVEAWLDDRESRAALSRALFVARSVANVSPKVAEMIEDAFAVGMSPQPLHRALAACRESVVIFLGAGLGNMIYGTGMVRWLSERLNAPVDLVIHDRFDIAVSLFAGAPWLNAVYPGFEYLAGRHYTLLVSAVTGGAMRPPFTADRTLWLDQLFSYNEEGRFIPEPRLNFLGFEGVSGETPALTSEVPMPFIRDTAYRHPGDRVIGIAHGQKDSAWAKREWDRMETLVADLVRDDWDVRSFGLPAEYVEGARDFTGLPMRQVVEEIAKCSYFLSHDGGLCHIAEAIGVPTIWLFGATGSIKNGPVYAHSRTLLSWRECGPCLYKIDWLRCEDPACMADLGVAQVRAELEALVREIEREGYAPRPRATDATLLDYEIGGQRRPSPPALQRRNLAERIAALPRSQATRARHAATLFLAGDLFAAAEVATILVAEAPDDLRARMLHAVSRQAYPGPTPADALLRNVAAIRPPAAEDAPALVDAILILPLEKPKRRALFEAIIRYWLWQGNTEAVRALILSALASVSASSDLFRMLHRVLERLQLPAPASPQMVDMPNSPSLARMTTARSRSVREHLQDVAAEMAAVLSLSPQEILDRGLAPGMPVPEPDAPKVTLNLGGVTHSVPRHAAILILARHVRQKNAVPTSTSRLIMHHARRLAARGLRPIIATIGFDDVPDGWSMRDSVTFIQAHASWEPSQWHALLGICAPALVIDYDRTAHAVTLPDTGARPVVAIDLPGLRDRDGFETEFTSGRSWSLTHGDDLSGDTAHALTEALFVPPNRRVPLVQESLCAAVLVPDIRDLRAALDLAAAMPEVRFDILADVIYRGIEKNVRIYPTGEKNALDDAGIVVHFAHRSAVLPAEAIRAVETGRTVITATAPGGCIANHITTVTDPEQTLSWRSAIEASIRADRVARARNIQRITPHRPADLDAALAGAQAARLKADNTAVLAEAREAQERLVSLLDEHAELGSFVLDVLEVHPRRPD